MKKYYYYLLLACPFLLFVFVLNFPAPPWPDHIVYESVARDFFKTGIFRYLIWGDFDPTYLNFNFNNGPLYPFVHLVFLKLFGSTDPRIAFGFNYLLAFLTFINVSNILRLENRQKLFLALLAFNPLVYHYTNIARPEWLGLFIFSCLWRTLVARDEKLALWRYLLAGAFLALAALNHQFAIFYIPIVAYAIYRRENGWRRRSIALGLVAASTAFFLSPYLYYIGRHFADFKYQLFSNQISAGQGVAGGPLKFIKSFFVPLFYPSISFLTQTGKIPRWQADLVPFSVIVCIVALLIKWKKGLKLSPITIEAGVFWFILNLGCAFSTYSPYVTVSVSIFAVALIRDIFPDVSPRAVKVLVFAMIVAVLYQLWFYNSVSSKLFRSSDYRMAAECIAQKIPNGETLYVLAYPDPSVQLNNLRSDLDIRRYIDFEKYADAWKDIVPKRKYFVISPDRYLLDRFDYRGALRNEYNRGKFTEAICSSGNVSYTLWSRR